MTYYKQCVLTKNTTTDVAWIPEEFATIGKYLKVIGVDGWKIMRVGSIRESESYLAQYGRTYLDHRKVTDI